MLIETDFGQEGVGLYKGVGFWYYRQHFHVAGPVRLSSKIEVLSPDNGIFIMTKIHTTIKPFVMLSIYSLNQPEDGSLVRLHAL